MNSFYYFVLNKRPKNFILLRRFKSIKIKSKRGLAETYFKKNKSSKATLLIIRPFIKAHQIKIKIFRLTSYN